MAYNQIFRRQYWQLAIHFSETTCQDADEVFPFLGGQKRDVENSISKEIAERSQDTHLFCKTICWFPHLEPLSVVLFRILKVDEKFECITANLSGRN
jgi:hypothetical protein